MRCSCLVPSFTRVGHVCLQDLKAMVANDAVFKADGVIYTSDTKGEGQH